MSDFSFPNVTWTQFAQCNDNRSYAFEDMCWELFHIEFLKENNVPHANHNHPGVEVEPVLEPLREDGSPRRWVSFQAKYFTKDVNYTQIRDSLTTAVKKYKGNLDHIYLFCNQTLTTTSDKYQKTEKIVTDAGMTLQPVSDKDILNLIKKNRAVAEYYFLQRRIKDINLYGRLLDRFSDQYSDHPSIKLMKPDPRLFPKGLPVIDNSKRTATEGKRDAASIKDMILESWNGAEKKHILFVGEGGIGKTVAMLTLPNEEWFKAYKIPVIYIPLQILQNYHGELNSYINSNYRNELDGINELATAQWTDHPNLIILLDGFNEIPSKHKQEAENHIVEWMNKPGVQIITTSRINTFLNSRFLEYTLQPLPYETSRDYLISTGTIEEDLPPENDSLWKVINVPLMLTMFTQNKSVKKRVSDSAVSKYLDWKDSDNAAHIIWNYLQVELYRLTFNNGSAVVPSSAAILAVAPYVCYEMAKNGKFYVEQEEFQELLRKAIIFFAKDQTMLPKQIAEINKHFDELGKEKPFEASKWEEYFNILSKQSVLFQKKFNKNGNGKSDSVYVPAHQNFRDALAAVFISECLLNSSGKAGKREFPKEVLYDTDSYVKDYISELLTDDELITIWDFHRVTEPKNGRVTWILMDIIGRKRDYDYSELDFSGLDLTGINLHQLLSRRLDICPLPQNAELLNKTKISFENLLPEGHAGIVTSASYSSDGKHLASGSSDKTVRIWDLENGTSRVLEGHTDYVASVSYSPDGRYVASGSSDKTVRIWNLENGTSRVLEGHTDYVASVSYSPDGRYVASGSGDNTVRIWDLESGTSRVLKGHTLGAVSVSYSPDGKYLASSSWGIVHIWNLENGTSRVLEGHTSNVTSVSYSPDRRHLASASDDKTVRIWDLENGTSHVLEGHVDRVTSVSYSPDGRYLASGSRNGTVRIWDLESGTSRVLKGHTSNVTSVSYSPDRRHLVSASSDKTVRIWDLENGTSRVLEGNTVDAISVSITYESIDHISRVSDDSKMSFWNLESNRIDRTEWTKCVSYSMGGKHLASISSDNKIHIWNLENGTMRTLEEHTERIDSVLFSMNGKHLASISSDNKVRIWDLESGTSHVLEGSINWKKSMLFSPDGKQLAGGSHPDTVCVWDIENGTMKELKGHTGNIESMSYSPDGRHLASGSEDSTVRVWDIESGSSHVLEGCIGDVTCVSYSPDGKKLACASYGKKVLIWDLKNLNKQELSVGLVSNDVLLAILNILINRSSEDIIGTIFGAMLGAIPGVVLFALLGTILGSILGTMIGALLGAILGVILGLILSSLHYLEIVSNKVVDGGFILGTILGAVLVNRFLSLPVAVVVIIIGAIPGAIIGRLVLGYILQFDYIIDSLSYSTDGRHLAGSSHNGRVYIWDLENGTSRELKVVHKDKVINVSYSLDGRSLIGESNHRRVYVWDTVTGKIVKKYRFIENVNLIGANFMQAIVSKKDREQLKELGAKA